MDILVDPVDKINSVPGEEGQNRINSLLRMLPWIDEVIEVGGIGFGPIFATEGLASDLAFDFAELMEDLGPALVESGGEGRVEAIKPVPQFIDMAGYRVSRLHEHFLEVGGDQPPGDMRLELFESVEAVPDGDIETPDQLRGAWFQEREGGTRHSHRHSPEQGTIEDLCLGKVSDLGGSRDIGHCRKDVVLHHRAKESVGRERLGLLHQLGFSEALLARLKSVPLAAQWNAAPIPEQEEEARGIEVYLGMITGAFQLLRALLQPAPKIIHQTERFPHQWGRQRSDGRFQGIEKEQAFRQDAPHQFLVSLAKRAARSIGNLRDARDLVTEREFAKRRAQFVEGRIPEWDRTDRPVAGSFAGDLEKDGLLGGVERPTVVDLGDVVILGGHPEHGRRGDAPSTKLARELDCGKSFVDAVRRSSEKAGLLARNHGDGIRASQNFERLVLSVLLPKRRHQRSAARLWETDLAGHASVGSRFEGVSRIKRRDAIEVIEEVRKKPACLRKLGMANAKSFHAISLNPIRCLKAYESTVFDRSTLAPAKGDSFELMIDEQEFQKQADRALSELDSALGEVADDYEFEPDFQAGALTLEFEDPPAKFVISPNAPVRQIWVSALTTSFKLDWDPGRSEFVLAGAGQSLKELMADVIGKHLGQGVKL